MRLRDSALVMALSTVVSLGGTTPAWGFVQPKGAEAPLETVGAPARTARTVSWRTGKQRSASADRGLERLRTDGFGKSQWDTDTGVPLRLWGQGQAAPGANADASVAATVARTALARHLAVLAPGASVDDFTLLANVTSGGVRTVSFAQHARGLRVVGASISFSFKANRLVVIRSQALPDVDLAVPARSVTSAAVRASAERWLGTDLPGVMRARAPGERVIFPIIHGRRGATGPAVELRVAHTVEVAAEGAPGLWDVYVDASSGAPIARRSKLHYAQGTVYYQVPSRYPGGEFTPFAARDTTHSVDTVSTTADAAGLVTWSTDVAATVLPGLVGPFVKLLNQGGSRVSTTLQLVPDGSITWDVGTDTTLLSQLNAFIHANLGKDYARTHGYPNPEFLDEQLEVNVNESGECNAYSTGDDIHFFPASGDCDNTGAIADVVYHELGHSLHYHAIVAGAGDFDSALSEGLSDYFAATITGDAGMGRGFFYSSDPLRDIDPDGSDAMWPGDQSFDTHVTGLIIAGALWDFRKAMVLELGEADGVAKANEIFWAVMARSADIPSSYVEALLADDDNGNLDDGTPHMCALSQAFGAHGLTDVDGPSTVGAPAIAGLAISVPVTDPPAELECPPPTVTGGSVEWQLRDDTDTAGTLDLARVEDPSPTWTGELPAQADGTVIQYRIRLQFTNGNETVYPNNPADPYYETYVGPVTTVWCDDFDDDPTDWETGSIQGANQWEWGSPEGSADSGDPEAAFTGDNVFGVALGGDGFYDSSANQFAKTPAIDVRGYQHLRLQYRRWLNVEDGIYDHATIAADGTTVWSNAVGNQTLHHRDREWRFHDVDLGDSGTDDGSLEISFGLETDRGLELGGWTVDDVCVVAVGARAPVCGDGAVDDAVDNAEECDDGNNLDGDGCSAACVDENPADPGCCSTGSHPGGPIVLGLMTLGLALLPRRRRRVR